MEDTELTRLAIAEIVREMGELKEPQVQERKVNPLGRPNKRFLGRTINSMISHNKRENERTRANCREMLRRLDARRCRSEERLDSKKLIEARRRTRSKTPELVLSSSEKGSACHKSRSRTKKSKKTKRKKRKHKSGRRKSRSRSRSRTRSSRSSGSRSRTRNHSRHKHVSLRRKKRDITISKCINVEEDHYEENIHNTFVRNSMQLDTTLASLAYSQQLQQMCLYRNMLESIEIETAQQEPDIEDTINAEQSDRMSSSSSISFISLDEPCMPAESKDDVYTIQLCSSSSSACSHREDKNTENESLKSKAVKNKCINVDSSSSSSSVVFDFETTDSNSSHLSANNYKRNTNESDCISLDSDSKNENATDAKANETNIITLDSTGSESEGDIKANIDLDSNKTNDANVNLTEE